MFSLGDHTWVLHQLVRSPLLVQLFWLNDKMNPVVGQFGAGAAKKRLTHYPQTEYGSRGPDWCAQWYATTISTNPFTFMVA